MNITPTTNLPARNDLGDRRNFLMDNLNFLQRLQDTTHLLPVKPVKNWCQVFMISDLQGVHPPGAPVKPHLQGISKTGLTVESKEYLKRGQEVLLERVGITIITKNIHKTNLNPGMK
jgi:hypothetical protein